jgi:hypothetical protein
MSKMMSNLYSYLCSDGYRERIVRTEVKCCKDQITFHNSCSRATSPSRQGQLKRSEMKDETQPRSSLPISFLAVSNAMSYSIIYISQEVISYTWSQASASIKIYTK